MDILIEATGETDIREVVFSKCHEFGNPLLMMKPLDISLEDIFLQVTENGQAPVTQNNTKVGDE